MKSISFFLILLTLVFLPFFQSCMRATSGTPRHGPEQVSSQSAHKDDREIGPDAYYHYMAAQIKRNEGLLDEAIEEHKRAVLYDSQSSLLRLELSRLYINKGLMEKAVAQCVEAIALDRKNIEALLTLGGIYSAQNKTELAVEQYKRVLAIDTQNLNAYRYLAAGPYLVATEKWPFRSPYEISDPS